MNSLDICKIESQYLHGKVIGWFFYHLKYKKELDEE